MATIDDDLYDALKALVIALDNYFESDTFKRFLTLFIAEEKALRLLKWEPLGWACGWRMFADHNRKAAEAWQGHTVEMGREWYDEAHARMLRQAEGSDDY